MSDDRKIEHSGLHHEDAKDRAKPIVDNWNEMHLPGVFYTPDPKTEEEKKAAREWSGSVSLTLNPDGTYNLSGQLPGKYVTDGHNYNFHIVFGVKSAEGSTLFFTHSMVIGKSYPQNYAWNKQGMNSTLKDNFASFAKKHDWHASNGLTLSPTQPAGETVDTTSGGSSGPSVGDVIGDVAAGLGVLLSFL
jgi:hypothetical protein